MQNVMCKTEKVADSSIWKLGLVLIECNDICYHNPHSNNLLEYIKFILVKLFTYVNMDLWVSDTHKKESDVSELNFCHLFLCPWMWKWDDWIEEYTCK